MAGFVDYVDGPSIESQERNEFFREEYWTYMKSKITMRRPGSEGLLHTSLTATQARQSLGSVRDVRSSSPSESWRRKVRAGIS